MKKNLKRRVKEKSKTVKTMTAFLLALLSLFLRLAFFVVEAKESKEIEEPIVHE